MSLNDFKVLKIHKTKALKTLVYKNKLYNPVRDAIENQSVVNFKKDSLP